MEKFEWTAPEARATKVWTEKCDVYSLGLLLYKLLTGRQPLKGKTRELVSPRQYVPECPPALASALLAALNDDPAERVDLPGLLAKLDAASDQLTENDADEVAEALRQTAVPPLPVAVPPITTPTRAQAPMGASATRPRRFRSWVRPLLAVAAGTALALAWWGRSPTATTDLGPDAAASVLAAATRSEPAPPLPAVVTSTTTSAPPKMHDALDAAAPELRRCSALAGEPLIIEFTTIAGGDQFGSVVSGSTLEAVDRCVRDATAPLRFQPQAPENFTQEYTP